MSETDDFPRLPIEDLDEGLYIPPFGIRVTHIERGDESDYHVDAMAYMKVQRERDNYRKACALINAWRMSHPEFRQELRGLASLLADVGLSDRDGVAMIGLIASVKRETASDVST